MTAPANLLDAVERRREAAMDDALAAITERAIRRRIAAEVLADRIAADRRHAFLASAVERYAPRPELGYGMVGGMGVFADLMRPEQAVFIRARSLLAARAAQLGGNHAFALTMLAKAARLRPARVLPETERKAA